MKECPVCHRKYDDSLNFCTVDGHQLNSVGEIPANMKANDSEKPQKLHPRKNGGCLKKVIIGAIVLVIGLVAFYNYLMNTASYLRTEPSEVHAVKAGGQCKVDIDYDGYIWTVNHQPDWVEIDEHDNDFMLIFAPNRSGQLREGSITIQSGKLLAQVMVKQNAYATIIRASETAVKFGKSGGNKDIIIETDGCAWDAEYTNWMTVTKVGGTELHISCPRNDGEYRTGTISVKEDNARVTISVIQSGNCNNCHGSGEVPCSACAGLGGMGYGTFYSNCMWCGGRGKTTCGLCNGMGIRE